MPSVDIDHLQDLPQLIEQAIPGETITLTRAGKTLATVIPTAPEHEPGVSRRLGGLEGMYSVPADFDEMFAAEIEDMFYGDHG